MDNLTITATDHADWSRSYLEDLDAVPGLDAEQTRELVARFAFGVGDDAEVAAALRGIDTTSPGRLAVTMFSLGLATAHASEARLAHGAGVIDLREPEEVRPAETAIDQRHVVAPQRRDARALRVS